MASTYSSLLRIELIANGEQSGTWGTTTNTNLGTLIEAAIAGTASVDVTSANVTLTANDGSSDQSRCMILNVTGTPGTSRNIVAPSSSKSYIVKNGSDGAVVVKGSATTGVTIGVNQEAFVFWNGSDFELVGLVGPSGSTDNAFARFDGTSGKVLQNASGATLDDTGSASFTGSVAVAGTASAAADVKLYEDTDNGTNYVALKAPASVASDLTLTLPSADGTSGQVIQTDGSGNLSFATPSAGVTTGKAIAMAMIFGF